MAYTPQPDTGLPQWCITVAHWLGWSEPGLVMFWTAFVVVVALPFLYAGFLAWMLHIASECRYEASETDNVLAQIWYWFIAVIALTIVVVLELIMGLLLIWAGYSMLKQFRDWWHKEM